MKNGFIPIFATAMAIFMLLSTSPVLAVEGTDDVSIERYIEFEIHFDHGDSLHIEVDILAAPYPITIFLIKGEDAHRQWLETEDVDIGAIKNGTDVSNMTVDFRVIENFSEQNTTSFKKSIDIGEQDTYYLVITLHRYSGMSSEDALSRATEVQYSVDWSIEEKEVPWYLLIFAGILFAIGVVLIGMYFHSTRKAGSEPMDTEEVSDDRRPAPPLRRKGPPRFG